MAAPIISGIDAPSTVAPGETFQVQIHASDPDSQSVTLTAQASDSQGNVASKRVTISIQDPLTYALEDTDGAGFTWAQDPDDPSIFHVTAP